MTDTSVATDGVAERVATDGVAELTVREREVLDLVTSGESTHAIAGRLGISPNTVRTHLRNLMAKLDVSSRLEAAAWARRHDLGARRTVNAPPDAPIGVFVACRAPLLKASVKALVAGAPGFELDNDGGRSDLQVGVVDDIGAVDTVELAAVARSKLVAICGTVEGAIAALGDGAASVVSSENLRGELLDAVAAVARGQAYVAPWMLGPVLQSLIEQRRSEQQALERLYSLSKREREVLACLAEGNTEQAIAEQLFISSNTVRTHIGNLMSKLGVHSRLEAVAVLK